METNRERILDALDIYSEPNTSFLFASAVRMLGFPGPVFNKDTYSTAVGTRLNVDVDLSRIPHSLNSKKLYPYIRSAIREASSSESEIEFLISDIISKFSEIIDYVNPEASYGEWDKQIAALTLHATTWYEQPFDSTVKEWKKYELHYNPDLSAEDLEKAIDYRKELYDKFLASDIYRRFYSVMEDMNVVAGLIDAALLENHCEHDFFYFQSKAGGVLTHKLRTYDLHRYSGVNSDRINSLFKDRDFYYAVPPSESLLPELKEQIECYRNNGIWNMTKLSYIQVIAADEETRKGNLASYFSDFHRYVNTFNDDGTLRDLGPIFYDLFELWHEVSYWKGDGAFPKFPCKDIEIIFEKELIRYVCITYFVYLINRKNVYFDVYTLFPGLTADTILNYLYKENHFLDKNDFLKYEEIAEESGYIYQPFEGFYRNIESTRDAKKHQKAEAQKESDKPALPDATLFIAELEKGKVMAGFDTDPVATKLAEAVVEASEDTACPVEGKLSDAEVYRDAHLLYGKLCTLKIIKSTSPSSYRWCAKNMSDNKARAILGYLCYMMWRYIMPDNDQIDRTVFCSIIQSNYDHNTIGTYARDFKKQYEIKIGRIAEDGKKHKSIPSGIKRDIDKIFADLQKEGYFRKPY